MKITELQLSYLAGFFDGEGCINISRQTPKKSKTPHYSLQIVVAQADYDILAEFQEITGLGSIHKKAQHERSLMPIYDWRLSTHHAAELLLELLPYLKLKKDQAELAIEFANKQGREHLKGKGKGRGYSIPSELVAEKESYYLRMRNLKHPTIQSGAKLGRPFDKKSV